MKYLFIGLAILAGLLTGCGMPVDGGLIFKTADPALALFVPLIQPEVIPEEEVGEVVPDPTPVPPCGAVKGNISSSGEKIYHVEGGAYYDQVKIDESAGEAFFCDTISAEAAGFRPALR